MSTPEVLNKIEAIARERAVKMLDEHPELSGIDAAHIVEIFTAGMMAGLDVAIATVDE